MSAPTPQDRERHEQRLYRAWHAAAAKARTSKSSADKEAERRAWAAFTEAYAPVRAQQKGNVA